MRESSLEEGVRHKQEIAKDNRDRQLRKEYVHKPKVEPDSEVEVETETEVEPDPDPDPDPDPK